MNTEMTTEEINTIIDGLISTVGNKLMIKERKESGSSIQRSKEEMNEIIQLYFCLERNLNRGTRTRTATVPLSSLLSLAETVSPPLEQPTDDEVFVETGDLEVKPTVKEASEAPEAPAIKDHVVGDNNNVIIRSTDRIEMDNIVELYNNRRYGKNGLRIDANAEQFINQVRYTAPKQVIFGPTNSDDLFDKNLDRVLYRPTSKQLRGLMSKKVRSKKIVV